MKILLLFVGCILLSLVGCSQDIIERSRTFEIKTYNISLNKERKHLSNRSRPLLSNDLSTLDTILVDKGYDFQYGTGADIFFSVKIEYLLESRFSQDSVKLTPVMALAKKR
ncbi:hypothetical protein GCM10011386_35040 [Parapedobacter defluvii]|uniref:DUF4136 domain-containing protein n=1 Tax=Parapedobacter defluvii TaxID=2045106 RepID=A0ABQ1MGB8_9SPHI|nr:MAG: hypothetical protein EAS52_01050 [Parapedobacter sp.]GGC39958.1 hypothetical protein GCM10011386_35040 [Parapedobacter defluvii]